MGWDLLDERTHDSFFFLDCPGSSGTRVPCKGDNYSSAAAAGRMPLSSGAFGRSD